MFCNIPRCSATAVDWNTLLMQQVKDNDVKELEPTEEARDDWVRLCEHHLEHSLLATTSSWFTGVNKNVSGAQKREILFYAGGNPEFKQLCREIAEDNWRGFLFDGKPAVKLSEPA